MQLRTRCVYFLGVCSGVVGVFVGACGWVYVKCVYVNVYAYMSIVIVCHQQHKHSHIFLHHLTKKHLPSHSPSPQALTLLLTSTMAAAGDTQLNPAADDFAQGVTRHMAMLFACGVTKPITIPTPGVYAGNKTAMLRELNATLFLPALLQVASDDDTHKADKGRELLALFLRTLLAVHGEQTRLGVQRVDRLGPEGSASGSLPAKVQLEALQKVPFVWGLGVPVLGLLWVCCGCGCGWCVDGMWMVCCVMGSWCM